MRVNNSDISIAIGYSSHRVNISIIDDLIEDIENKRIQVMNAGDILLIEFNYENGYKIAKHGSRYFCSADNITFANQCERFEGKHDLKQFFFKGKRIYYIESEDLDDDEDDE